jgi:hypothetical protein
VPLCLKRQRDRTLGVEWSAARYGAGAWEGAGTACLAPWRWARGGLAAEGAEPGWDELQAVAVEHGWPVPGGSGAARRQAQRELESLLECRSRPPPAAPPPMPACSLASSGVTPRRDVIANYTSETDSAFQHTSRVVFSSGGWWH